ncbi:MAG: DEAD/DEAH box helicase family protein [Gemmatimonadota bacterium]|nr:DEAD/DEAH box helicase family protein [Gemmatimonadota bacterium]MDE2870224.1 DEAD/DEAH box helicase family protein [Gemmatimonadota bacterium]
MSADSNGSSTGNPSVKRFFERPILNNPYEYPRRHWELDAEGQPTHRIRDGRRPAEFVTPFPSAQQHGAGPAQARLRIDPHEELSTDDEQYLTAQINTVRRHVDRWRDIPNPNDWGVTPTTARLLRHWRSHKFSGIRPFFCQVEAAETAIWLTEVAPRSRAKAIVSLLRSLEEVSHAANPGLSRLALKMATGAGKTTVMAMLIAWQTINAVRHPNSPRFTRGFLVVTPGITIRDRLRVLQPNDPDAYYRKRELIPSEMLRDIHQARIVITNYHAFKLRERAKLPKGNRALLTGSTGTAPETLETEGQMLQRVMPALMGQKRVMVFNDEAHHCYREKPGSRDEEVLKGDDRKEARQNTEAARLWIAGIEAVARRLDVSRVMDLSATPFFLRGSGYAEGTLFPWTMSDFSLMDAIECGIVKLPRVPVADNIPGREMPMFRKLWEHIRDDMPKKGRGKAGELDPLMLPVPLQTALEALYGHYEKTFRLWEEAEIPVPPCFIIVCNNTSSSKLVYEYVSGFQRPSGNGRRAVQHGRLALFRNFDDHGGRLARPRTLLIDSLQLESGDALAPNFRKIAADEIERFRQERVERGGHGSDANDITDQELLREVMNTVGKPGTLGGSIRCVVSVSMLTEGWDANTVTHVLGVRAFGTQLLCEQAVGRALRRQSYDLNEENLFDVEYADVLGIPFDFTAEPVVAPAKPPRETVRVHAVRPERDELEIRFPRVTGYRVEPPNDRLKADFNEDHVLELTPELVGSAKVLNSGIVGEVVELNLEHLKGTRSNRVLYRLVQHLIDRRWRDPGEAPPLHLFGQLKRVSQEWLDTRLVCRGGTYPAQLLYRQLADRACDRIMAAIVRAEAEDGVVKAILNPYNPVGTTADVDFYTSKTLRHRTDPRRSHLNWAILDSSWEGEFCRVVEGHPKVLAYVKNHNLGFAVPYRQGIENRTYVPDFIVAVDDGKGADDPLNLVVEIKGFRGEDAQDKKLTMDSYWVPGVNGLGTFGRWAFAEFRDVLEMRSDFEDALEIHLDHVIRLHAGDPAAVAAEGIIRMGGSDPDAWVPPRKRPWEIWG